jgi:hypothetical protein
MGLLARIFRPSGLTHVSPRLLFYESSQSGTHGTKPRQQPPNSWQVIFGLKNSILPPLVEVTECSVSSKIIG